MPADMQSLNRAFDRERQVAMRQSEVEFIEAVIVERDKVMNSEPRPTQVIVEIDGRGADIRAIRL